MDAAPAVAAAAAAVRGRRRRRRQQPRIDTEIRLPRQQMIANQQNTQPTVGRLVLATSLLTPLTVVGVWRLAVSVCDSVCVSVCVYPRDKTKTAETTITKLATAIVHHESSPSN